jgi:hypothetical protein
LDIPELKVGLDAKIIKIGGFSCHVCIYRLWKLKPEIMCIPVVMWISMDRCDIDISHVSQPIRCTHHGASNYPCHQAASRLVSAPHVSHPKLFVYLYRSFLKSMKHLGK